jgi:phosphate transport system protein
MEEDLHIDRHISRRYNEELQSLHRSVLAMGGLVEDQCRDALDALLNGDAELAAKVAGSDREINQMEVDISARCTDILVRRQPAASDLRMILAVIRVISDLERVGDEAEKVGRLAQRFAESHGKQPWSAESRHLGEGVTGMLHGALDAFARLDVDAAIATAGRDPEVDREFDALTRLMITHMMEEPGRVKGMLQVNWCARALERIGDHAVNICEQVVFLVEGSDVRHLPLDTIRQRFGSEE